jgi:TetR/AcrR family transcriptional repressor of nem operon
MARPRVIDDATLLDRSMQLFWRRGYAGAGVRDLEQSLGLKASAIYNRFGSKDGLFQATLDHYIDAVIGWRIEHYLRAADPVWGLRKFFDTTYDYISLDKPALSCLLVNTSLEIGPENIAVHAILKRGVARLRAALAENLRRRQAAGYLAADADIPALSRHLLICLHGLTVASTLGPDKKRLAGQVDWILSTLPSPDAPGNRTFNLEEAS